MYTKLSLIINPPILTSTLSVVLMKHFFKSFIQVWDTKLVKIPKKTSKYQYCMPIMRNLYRWNHVPKKIQNTHMRQNLVMQCECRILTEITKLSSNNSDFINAHVITSNNLKHTQRMFEVLKVHKNFHVYVSKLLNILHQLLRAGLDYGRSALIGQEFQSNTRLFETTIGMTDKIEKQVKECLKLEFSQCQVFCLII